MLTYRWVESNSGPPRKYFSLTPKGEEFYKELEATWNELANAVNKLTSQKESLVSTAGNVSFGFDSSNIPTNTSTTDKQEVTMKKVININFQGRVIPIEETAFELLKQYIESLRRYFANEEGRDEIINDIESRIAELFSERIKKGAICITDDDVNDVIASMGRPEDFEAEAAGTESNGGTCSTTAIFTKVSRLPVAIGNYGAGTQ